MNELAKSPATVKIGLALVSMSVVLLEMILTRLFSASAGYHFAFMIVSMTMFGMTAGALYAFARPPANESDLFKALAKNASLSSIGVSLAYVAHHFVNEALSTIGPFAWIALTFLVYSVTFFFAGACVCFCLTRFQEVGKLYCADLIGAAISCPLLIMGLTLADPQTIVAFSAFAAAIGALFFAGNIVKIERTKQVIFAVVAMALCALPFVPQGLGSMPAVFGKVEYLKWSPIGRVVACTVNGPPETWARVKREKPPLSVPQKLLWIDFGASTVMTAGDATPEQLEPIKRDVTAVGNWLRPGRSLFVIGVGGGRDVLTGLLHGQKKIDGIEVNPAIVSMLRDKYGDFNGHLTRRPGVNIVNDEARNWLARSNNKYGLIQCSLVDTWAASSSGAFMLTENVLYTKEAFELYIKHVEQDGVLCFLRWGDQKESGQILRMLNLAKSALHSIGVKDVGAHIMLITSPFDDKHNVGTMLVSPQPFSQADIDKLVSIAKEEGYSLMWVPGVAKVEPFASAITTSEVDPGMPTDDRPFFFTPVKAAAHESTLGEPAKGLGLTLLIFTFCLTLVLVVLVILFPLWKSTGKKLGSRRHTLSSILFFSSLGVAFMLIEVAQVQRLTVLLGNPTYGLSIVLFALLLSSGAGSYIAQILFDRGSTAERLLQIGLVMAAALTLGSALTFTGWLPMLEPVQLGTRIAVALPLVALPGFFMGWGFPLGMTIFTREANEAGAWFWAINGATSVLSSVLAAMISIVWGIETTLATGAICYLVALLSLFILKGGSKKRAINAG
jgi:hypothetical protein